MAPLRAVLLVIFASSALVACDSDPAAECDGGCDQGDDDDVDPPPAPASYDEIGPALEAIGDRTLAAGRAVVADLVAGDVAAARARFTAELAAQLDEATIADALAQAAATAPIGAPLGERWLLEPRDGGGVTAFVEERAWGATTPLQFRVGVTAEGQIAVLELTGVEALPADPSPGPVSVALRPPFDGAWLVGEGPATEVLNHHAVDPSQRHAYDIVVWRDGATFSGDGLDNQDYFAWRQPLLAPAAGTVIEVLDGQPDIAPSADAESGPDEHPGGNHVVIDLGAGQFASFGHLQRGSVAVAVGDVVAAGQRLGRVGNSGNTTEPHIHFHVQDAADFFAATAGFAAPFADVLLDGVATASVEAGSPQVMQWAGD